MEVNKVPFNKAHVDIMELLESMRDTVLAGGAVRDHLTSQPIQDFDFFTVKREESEYIRVLKKLGVEKIKNLEMKNSGYKDDRVAFVLFGEYRGKKCNFISLSDEEFNPSQWLKDFCFGPSEVGVVKEGNYIMTRFFQMFLEESYVITTKEKKKEDGWKQYLNKMSHKYPKSNYLWLHYDY